MSAELGEMCVYWVRADNISSAFSVCEAVSPLIMCVSGDLDQYVRVGSEPLCIRHTNCALRHYCNCHQHLLRNG